ncbi:MAG: PAS domain-containing protein, partial [Desulfuromonadales bacterium]|nr:PAS domain-containing protein [Desulfuromonadales bacterium]
MALRTREIKVGFLVVDKIAFPNYLKKYLNIAISLAPLCAFVINKALMAEKMQEEIFEIARLSNEIREKNQDLETTNQQLRASEENLRESEDTISLLLNSTTEGVCGLDADGICTSCNQSALTILGYEEHNLIGQTLHDLIAHRKMDGSRVPMEDCINCNAVAKGQTVFNDDIILWKSDGNWFPAEARAIPTIQDGQIVGSVFSFFDSTDKKRLMEQRLRTSQLASLGELAAGMAHEINNPLAGIMQAAEVVQMRTTADSSKNREAAR